MSAAWPKYFFASVSILLFMLTSCESEQHAQHKAAEELEPLEIEVITAEEIEPLRQVEIMASVEAAQSASIAAKISGNITELPVNLGSKVSSGDILVIISADEIKAKLSQAQAQLEQSKRNLTRERNLLKKNAATSESVKTLEERNRIAQATFNEVQTMLDYATIRAPFDGVITSKPSNVGDLATPGRTLLTLENESSLQVITDVPEALVLDLAIGDILPVKIDAANLEISGTVTEIAPRADPTSRTAPVKLQIPNAPDIRSGQFARVSLPGSRGTAIMVPKSAVQSFGQLERIYVEQDGRVRLQLVKTGKIVNDLIEILSGVSAGDRVVVSDTRELVDGRRVSVN
ncbi:MAG: efflux RND transporter periplasmic adaptor subunit [Desulfofustis sp.]|nr:efflux RND transporter periplasmic adaptor subunit [Desulfofustis sp.]